MFLFSFVIFSFLFRADISLFFFNSTFENLISHISSYNYDNYSIFPNVPECSGMFHVPGFIDGPKYKNVKLYTKYYLNSTFQILHDSSQTGLF